MVPSDAEVAAAEAALRAQTMKAPRVDPNHAHRPPAAPPLLRCSKEEADAVIAAVLARLED
jgi:hypothetical protein